MDDWDKEEQIQLIRNLPLLSHVGKTIVKALHHYHPMHHRRCWNVTTGHVVGKLRQTPEREYWGKTLVTPETEHSDWLPWNFHDIIIRGQEWIDITSLSPPDGKFLIAFQDAFRVVAENANQRGKHVTIRCLFGNIVGQPVDTRALRKKFLERVPKKSNIRMWVGAWRKGVSWNHSKIIAVDGQYLFTGGHNLWDPHYLQNDPTHDLSMELQGDVAIDGHMFANRMWHYINTPELLFKKVCTKFIPAKMHPWDTKTVGVSRFPKDLPKTAPFYVPRQQVRRTGMTMISMGRYGALHLAAKFANPSDSGFVAMLASAQRFIKLSQQDIGPPAVPTPTGYEGLSPWPIEYLTELACALYYRQVQVHIVVSNPISIPGGLSRLEAQYGNGWSCSDVTSEILKRVVAEMILDEACDGYDDADTEYLGRLVNNNLRVCYLKNNLRSGGSWPDGERMGNHAKFMMIDDCAYYLGSQNLYPCNLGEWGVVIDDKAQAQKIIDEYWNPLWKESFDANNPDADLDEVMDKLMESYLRGFR